MGTINWSIEQNDVEIVYEIEYSISGSYSRGSYDSPPEYPEVEVEDIYDEKGVKIDPKEWAARGFTDAEIERVLEKAMEDANDRAFDDAHDYAEPDDDRD